MKNNYDGLDIEKIDRDLDMYATCTSCKKPSSYKG